METAPAGNPRNSAVRSAGAHCACMSPAAAGPGSRSADLLARGVEHGAGQLAAVAGVARVAGRTGVDHQHAADPPTSCWWVWPYSTMSASASAKRASRRFPGERIRRAAPTASNAPAAAACRRCSAPAGAAGRRATGQLRVDAVAGPGPGALRPEEIFLVVADDHLRVALPQSRPPRWKSGIRKCCRRDRSARRHRPSA